MKKIIAALLVAILAFSLCACGNANAKPADESAQLDSSRSDEQKRPQDFIESR